MELLYDGPHVQVLSRRGSSDYALVTFNGRGFRADGKTIWAQPLVDKLDLNAIGFVTKAPNWFPRRDMRAAYAAARPFLEPFAERIGYGYSQGGYAVIKASQPLRLTRTLAVSPQFSIDPRRVVDPRFNKFFDADLHPDMKITDFDKPRYLHIFYDRGNELDRRHVDRIVHNLPQANLYHLPLTGHDTIRALVGSKTFAELNDSLASGDPHATVSRLRRASQIRKQNLTERALKKGRADVALALYQRLDLDPATDIKLMTGLAKAGFAREMLPFAEALVGERPKSAFAQSALAYVLALAGEPARAQGILAALDPAKVERGTAKLAQGTARVLKRLGAG